MIKHLQKYPKLSVKNKKLDNGTLEIIMFSDSSISGKDDGSSKVRFMILIADTEKKTSLV